MECYHLAIKHKNVNLHHNFLRHLKIITKLKRQFKRNNRNIYKSAGLNLPVIKEKAANPAISSNCGFIALCCWLVLILMQSRFADYSFFSRQNPVAIECIGNLFFLTKQAHSFSCHKLLRNGESEHCVGKVC